MRRGHHDTLKCSSTVGSAVVAGLGIASLVVVVALALMGAPGATAAQLLAVSALTVGVAEAVYRSGRRQQESLAKAYVTVRPSRRR